MAERRWAKTLAMAALLLITGAGSVGFTQSQEGSLSGKLTDLDSKPLNGAVVVVRNQATGAEARSTTTKSGVYRFSELEPGEYTLEAEIPGAGRGQVEGIVIAAGHESRVQTALKLEPYASAAGASEAKGGEAKGGGAAKVPKLGGITAAERPNAKLTGPISGSGPHGASDDTSADKRCRAVGEFTDHSADCAGLREITASHAEGRICSENGAESGSNAEQQANHRNEWAARCARSQGNGGSRQR